MNSTLSPWAPPGAPPPVHRPMDRLAVTAFCVALVPWLYKGYTTLAEWTALPYPDERSISVVILALPLGFLLGLVAAIRIGRRGDQRRGLPLAIGAMLLPIAFFVLAVIVVAGQWYEEGLAVATWSAGVAPGA